MALNLDRTIDTRTEELLTELARHRNALEALADSVRRGYEPNAGLPRTDSLDRAFWTWRAMNEYKAYGGS